MAKKIKMSYKIKKLFMLLFMAFSFLNVNAQAENYVKNKKQPIEIRFGVSFEPVFVDALYPTQDYSFTPSAVFTLGNKSTHLKISLGFISRVGVYFFSKIPFIVGINYACHLGQSFPKQNALEFELGSHIVFGKNKSYHLTYGVKGGVFFLGEKFYIAPSISIIKKIDYDKFTISY